MNKGCYCCSSEHDSSGLGHYGYCWLLLLKLVGVVVVVVVLVLAVLQGSRKCGCSSPMARGLWVGRRLLCAGAGGSCALAGCVVELGGGQSWVVRNVT